MALTSDIIILVESVVVYYTDFIHNIQTFPKYFYAFLMCGENFLYTFLKEKLMEIFLNKLIDFSEKVRCQPA